LRNLVDATLPGSVAGLLTVLLYFAPVAAGLAAARAWRHLPDWPPAGRGLAAGLLTFLLFRDAGLTLNLGLDLAGWAESLVYLAAFLTGLLVPAYVGHLRTALPPVRRSAWTWVAALGLHGAAESWALPAALAAGGPNPLAAGALALRQLAAGWGVGLLLTEGHLPSRRELGWAMILGGGPAVLMAFLVPASGFGPWTSVLRAGAAGLLLAGLLGGRLLPGTHGDNPHAEWGFALAFVAGVSVMYLLLRLEGIP